MSKRLFKTLLIQEIIYIINCRRQKFDVLDLNSIARTVGYDFDSYKDILFNNSVMHVLEEDHFIRLIFALKKMDVLDVYIDFAKKSVLKVKASERRAFLIMLAVMQYLADHPYLAIRDLKTGLYRMSFYEDLALFDVVLDDGSVYEIDRNQWDVCVTLASAA